MAQLCMWHMVNYPHAIQPKNVGDTDTEPGATDRLG